VFTGFRLGKGEKREAPSSSKGKRGTGRRAPAESTKEKGGGGKKDPRRGNCPASTNGNGRFSRDAGPHLEKKEEGKKRRARLALQIYAIRGEKKKPHRPSTELNFEKNLQSVYEFRREKGKKKGEKKDVSSFYRESWRPIWVLNIE